MADGVERLGNLLALLLERPCTREEILNEVPGYPPNPESARIAFERDKRALREFGVAVEEVCVGGRSAYRVDPDTYYLPDLGLSDDEAFALRVALLAVRIDGIDAGSFGWLPGTGADAAMPGVRVLLSASERLPVLADAVTRRRVVRFCYGGLERVVEPYGMLFRDDFWYVCGFDRTREDLRNFRVDRIEGSIEVGEPGAFERPADFDPARAVPDAPWRLGAGPAVTTTVRVDAEHAHRAVRDAGEESVVARAEDGGVVVRLEVTSVEGLRSWLFGMLDHAVVLSPPEVRDEVVAWLEAMCQ